MTASIISFPYFLLLLSGVLTPLTVSFTVQVQEVQPDFYGSGSKIYIEHKVTQEDAKEVAKLLQPDLMIGTGCKQCTRREMLYCLSDDVLQDHCCCDRKFHEVFPYIEHTCYATERHCTTLVPNCGEYSKILNCCCHQYLGAKWKERTSFSPKLKFSPKFLFLLTMFVIFEIC